MYIDREEFGGGIPFEKYAIGRQTSLFKKRYVLLVGAVLAFISFGLYQVYSIANRIPRGISQVVADIKAPSQEFLVDRQVMVRALQEKLEVITFSMRLEKYVEGGVCGGNALQRFLHRDCIKEQVPATVSAGFNLNKVTADQISTTRNTVTVDIGSPRIQSVEMDHTGIKVNGEDVGLFVWPDPNLQPQLLAQAELAFRKDACTNGIMGAASVSAEKQIGTVLQTLLHAAGDKRTITVVSHKATC